MVSDHSPLCKSAGQPVLCATKDRDRYRSELAIMSSRTGIQVRVDWIRRTSRTTAVVYSTYAHVLFIFWMTHHITAFFQYHHDWDQKFESSCDITWNSLSLKLQSGVLCRPGSSTSSLEFFREMCCAADLCGCYLGRLSTHHEFFHLLLHLHN